MRHTRWAGTGLIALVVVLAVAFTLGGTALAKKPPKPPPDPDPVDGGLVYFVLHAADTYSVEPDGSDQTKLGEYVTGDPSRDAHACTDVQHSDPERWFLEVRPHGTGAYPNGVARHELYAVSECGAAVRLTDAADIEPDHVLVAPPLEAREFHARPRWFDGDGQVSYVAKRWSGESVVEWGIYVLSVDPDDLAHHAATRPAHVPVTTVLKVPEFYGGRVNITYDWSPDGTALVYEREANQGLWRADHDAVDDEWDQVSLIVGYGPDWASDTRRILFKSGGDIYEMDPYQVSSLTKVIACPATTSRLDYTLWDPRWSPNATHIVYGLITKDAKKMSWETWDVYRAAADGSGQTNLTGGTDLLAKVLGWVSDD